MLRTLSLTNFKVWESVERMRLAPLTGIFGSNSSGKTSVLQLLLVLKQTAESPDRNQVLNLGDDRTQVALGTYRDVVFRHDAKSKLSWSLRWDAERPLLVADPEAKGRTLFSGSELAFSAELSEGADGRVLVEGMSYQLNGSRFGMRRKSSPASQYDLYADAPNFHFKRTVGRKWPLPEPNKFYGFPDQVRAYFQNAGFLADLELEFEDLLRHTFYLGPLREYPRRQYSWSGGQPEDVGARGDRTVEALLAARTNKLLVSRGARRRWRPLEEHVAIWLRELGLVHSFSVEPIAAGSNLYHVKLRRTKNSAEVLLTDVGFGVSQILPVLVLCSYVPRGSIVILEQPEIHLHPAVQAGLADFLIETSVQRGVQVIVESHSEYLLQRLQRRIAEQRLTPADAALYFAEPSNGTARLNPLDVDMFGNVLNWPNAFFGDSFAEMAAMTEAAAKRQLAAPPRQ
jgi:predicted ATPase